MSVPALHEGDIEELDLPGRRFHTQFAANHDGALGGTNTVLNAANGLRPGMGASGNTFGTLAFGTLALTSTASVFDPRQVVMNLRLRF